MRYLVLIITVYLLSTGSLQAQHQEHTSEYAGQENREIKSLSQSDIDQLKEGKGWGLAKAAELNGVPGPSHILDMGKEIDLSDNQQIKIQEIFVDMQKKAIETGIQLISKEKELNHAFASKEVSQLILRILTSELGELRGNLTFIHLEAHLKAAEVLTKEQISLYNELRGYNLMNPCSEVPEGHDPEMWKRHNNCED
ncbi:MAG: hypothetical protein BalsKO_03880 [Balneolaceae bacterium]